MPRDTDDLKRALMDHSVDGYPVKGPHWFGKGFIVGEGVRTRDLLWYTVRPEYPISFDTMAQERGWSNNQMNLRQHLDQAGFREIVNIERELNDVTSQIHRFLKRFPPEIIEQLESGGTASWRDIKEIEFVRRNCLDDNHNVICESFSEDELEIPVEDLRPGMLVNFYDKKMQREFPGKIVGLRGSGNNLIVLLEVFEPTPFMDAPEAMAPDQIQPGFYSEETRKIGYGTHEAFQKAKVKLPPGKPQNDPESRRQVPHYILNDPIPLADIEAFCKKHYPDSPYCVWQCMILYIIPIHPAPISGEHQGGSFAPMPSDMAHSGEYDDWEWDI